MGDSHESRVQWMEWQNDMARHTALLRMEKDGSRLQLLEEEYRSDPDVVLAAVSSCPDSLEFAGEGLLRSRGWVVEAVQRNWRALEHVPEAMRSDRFVVLAASRQSLEALELAAEPLRSDRSFREQASAHGLVSGFAYEGECLRLVGNFNGWHTTDSATRMASLRPSKSSGVAGAEEDAAVGVVRHRLVVHLLDGWISFQAVSCTRTFDFRIFPAEDNYAAPEPFTMEGGDPYAVPAGVGGEGDGQGACFYIAERQGTTVCIYVELPEGQALTARNVLVWYEVERKPSRWPGLIIVRQPAGSERPKRAPAPVAAVEEDDEAWPEDVLSAAEATGECCSAPHGEQREPEDGQQPRRRVAPAPAPEQGSVRIVGADGPLCSLLVDLADDVRGLKQQLAGREGIPELAQRLLIGGAELHDRELLSTLVPIGGSVDVELSQRRPDLVEWLSRLREDRDKKSKSLSLAGAPAELLADATFMFAAVQQHERALQHAAPEMKGCREVVLAAVQQAGQALRLASPEMRADREVALAAVRRDGWALEFAAPELQADHDVALAAVQQDGWALQFASAEIQADREVVLAALESEGWAISSAAPELQCDPEVALAAVRQDWEVLEELAEELRGSRDFMLAAVREAGQALKFAAEPLLADREIAMAAVRQDGTAISLVAVEVQDYELVLAAARQDIRALQYVDKQLAARAAKALGKKVPALGAEPRKQAAVPEELRKLRKHFRTLGLEETATADEVRRRYRQLALQSHPDKHPDDLEGAKRKFQLINNAYQAIKEYVGL